MVISPRDCSAYSLVRIRDIPQGHAKSRSRSRRKSLKPKHGRTRRSRSCILLRATLCISQNMWAINILRLPLLRWVTPKLPGLSFHHRHRWRLPLFIINSQRASSGLATARPSGGVRSSHSQQHCARVEAYLLKVAQRFGQRGPCSNVFLLFFAFTFSLKKEDNTTRSNLQFDVISLWLHHRV
jgi:hypothetical protein